MFGVDESELLLYRPPVLFFNRFGRPCSAEEAGFELYKWWGDGMRGSEALLDFGEKP